MNARAIVEHIGQRNTPPRTARARGPPGCCKDPTEHTLVAEEGSAEQVEPLKREPRKVTKDYGSVFRTDEMKLGSG